ncbi:MAG: hypothetical protein IT379_04005, partial [Deltaproteobacteria bacterium]|nr:hypothetical protein [Deltaproteobacteria bacterium]
MGLSRTKRGSGSILGPGLVAVLALTGCPPDDTMCVVGASTVCACTDGRMGAQICAGDQLGPCVCNDGDAGVATRDGGGFDTGGATRDAAGAEDAAGLEDTGGSRDDDDAAGSRDAGRDASADGATDAGDAMDASDPSDAGHGDDGAMGADAGGSMDAGPDDDAAEPADSGSATDSGPPGTDAGAPRTIDDWADAYRAWAAAYCACSWTALGYASVDACIAERGLSASILTCARTGLPAAGAPVLDHFGCMTLAYGEATTCHTRVVACDATSVTTCEAMLDATLDLCVAPSGYAPFLAGVSACSRGGGLCPDSADTFGGTGEAIFTGTTIGAGDHYTASCGSPSTNDRVHLWGAFFDNVYVFDTEGSSFDTVLYVIDAGESLSCVAGAELACNDDAMPGRPTSRLELFVDVLPRVLV